MKWFDASRTSGPLGPPAARCRGAVSGVLRSFLRDPWATGQLPRTAHLRPGDRWLDPPGKFREETSRHGRSRWEPGLGSSGTEPEVWWDWGGLEGPVIISELEQVRLEP